MKVTQVNKALRLAYNQFDKWNDISGVIAECSSTYDEILAVIEDSVHIGIQMALYGTVKLNKDGTVNIDGITQEEAKKLEEAKKMKGKRK